MTQKSINRNDLILHDGVVQKFVEPNENQYSHHFLTVSSEDFDGVVIAIGDNNTGEELACFFMKDDDADRLAQAILIHSGKLKVI